MALYLLYLNVKSNLKDTLQVQTDNNILQVSAFSVLI